MLRNKFEYWRLKLAVEQGKEISQKEMAIILGVDYSQYNKWEVSGKPPTGASLWLAWKQLKKYFPNLNMQDLLQEAPE